MLTWDGEEGKDSAARFSDQLRALWAVSPLQLINHLSPCFPATTRFSRHCLTVLTASNRGRQTGAPLPILQLSALRHQQ